MKYAIISDLHLACDGANNTGWKDQELSIHLAHVLDSFDVVVLAGDVFECWQNSWVDQRQAFANTLLLYPRTWALMVAAALKGNLIYVAGNHDYVVYKDRLFPGIVKSLDVSSYCEEADTELYLHIEHGHGADALNSAVGWVGRAVAWVVGVLERWGWRDAEADLQRLEKYVPGRDQVEELYRDYALSYVRDHSKCWAVVMGHTHRTYTAELCQSRYGDGSIQHFYYNCGQFRPDYPSLVVADTETGSIQGLVVQAHTNEGS